LAYGQQQILNRSGVTLLVYPSPGTQIENYGPGEPATIANGGNATFSLNRVALAWRVW
jgi:hypothetical protein